MNVPIKSYKELIVWQKSVWLAKEIFFLTSYFPKSEIYGLSMQMRRADVAIPSNIAEGNGRRSSKEYAHFLSIAYGSALELETQLILSKHLCMLEASRFIKCDHLLLEVLKMLNVMCQNRRQKSGTSHS